MSQYVDGYVIPILKKDVKAYQKIAHKAGKLWIKHGAVVVFECIGEDLNPKLEGMKVLTFPKLTKSKKNESVLFSFIVYKSRKHRDLVNKRVMKDPLMSDPNYVPQMIPFDVKKMAYGGFETIVNLKKK